MNKIFYILLFLLLLGSSEIHAQEIQSDSIVKELLKEWGVPITDHNQVKLLKNGKAKFADMFDAIAQAKHHIHLEYFNFRNDSIASVLFELLAQKAAEGVEVRALFDAFGNMSNNQPLKNKHLKEIRARGIEIYKFDPIRFPYVNHVLKRDHRKIVVIDGKVAYTGGMNVADYYLNGTPQVGSWRDMHMSIEGPAVNDLQRIFLKTWNKVTKQHLDGEAYFFVEDKKVSSAEESIQHPSNIEASNIKTSNLGESNGKDFNLEDSNIKDSNLGTSSFGESNPKEYNIGESNSKESNLVESSLKDSNLGKSNVEEFNLGESSLKEPSPKESLLEEFNLGTSNSEESFLDVSKNENLPLLQAVLTELDTVHAGIGPVHTDVELAIVDREPGVTPKWIRRAYAASIDEADEKIQLINPYFVPTHSIKKALKKALKRGIDVEIMISSKSDIPFTPDASLYFAYKLVKRGAKVYLYDKGFHHSKIMMVDDTFCTLGSANLNSRSLRYDYEVNAFIFDKGVTKEMTDMFQADKQDSTELTKEVWKKRSRWKRFVGWFANIFAPFL